MAAEKIRYCNISLTRSRLDRRDSWRSDSFRCQRWYCNHRCGHRDRQLGLLEHRALRNEAFPTVREVRLDPSAPRVVRAHRLCWAQVRCLDCFHWRLGHCSGEQAFLPIDVSLRAEFMVSSRVGFLRLLPGENFTAQGCITDHCWFVVVFQPGVHDRVGIPWTLSSTYHCSSLWSHKAATANLR